MRFGHLDFKQFHPEVSESEVLDFFRQSVCRRKWELAGAVAALKMRGSRPNFSGGEVNFFQSQSLLISSGANSFSSCGRTPTFGSVNRARPSLEP